MQFADIRYKVELALLAIGLLGNLFLWFESDWFKGCEAYFGLFVSTFFTVVTGAGKLPAKYKIAGRTIAIFFLINFQEAAICNARKVFNDDYSGSPNDDTTRLVRAGTFFALFTTYLIFAERIVLPDTDKPLSSLIRVDNFKSIRNLMLLVASIFLIICQCVSWGIKDVCTTPPPNAIPMNMEPLTIALLLILGVVTNDTELMDLGIFVLLFGGIGKFKPIFNVYGQAPAQQDNYMHLWKAQIAFGFMALLLVVTGVLVHAVRFCSRGDGLSVVQRLMRPKTYALIFLCVFGLAGAACVWSRVPPKGQDQATFLQASEAWYAGIGGLVVPLLSVAGVLTATRAFSIVAVFFAAFTSQFAIAVLTAAGASTGYVRAGLVIVLFVLSTTPLIALSEGVRVADDPDVYFQGTNRTPMALCLMQGAIALLYWSDGSLTYHALFVIMGLCSALFFFSASNGDTSTYKTVMYLFYALLTSSSLWPLDRSGFNSTPANIAFVLIGWATIAFVNTLIPGAAFDCFHVDPEFSGIEQDVAKPFIESDAGGSYVAPDSDKPMRKYDNTTRDNAAAPPPPPPKDVEPVESYITSD